MREYQKDNNYEEIVTSPKNLTGNYSYTVARVVEEGMSVELHYCNGLATIEYMTEMQVGKWEGYFVRADWFNLDMSEDEILKILEKLYIEEFGQHNRNFNEEMEIEYDK